LSGTRCPAIAAQRFSGNDRLANVSDSPGLARAHIARRIKATAMPAAWARRPDGVLTPRLGLHSRDLQVRASTALVPDSGATSGRLYIKTLTRTGLLERMGMALAGSAPKVPLRTSRTRALDWGVSSGDLCMTIRTRIGVRGDMGMALAGLAPKVRLRTNRTQPRHMILNRAS